MKKVKENKKNKEKKEFFLFTIFNKLAKKIKAHKVAKPKTTSQIIHTFFKDFNEKTAKDGGMIFPVILTVYADKSFDYVLKTPPAAVLIKQAAKVEKASGKPHKEKVGKITVAQAEEIAKTKMKDLNASSLESAVSMVKGTARSMGIEVIG